MSRCWTILQPVAVAKPVLRCGQPTLLELELTTSGSGRPGRVQPTEAAVAYWPEAAANIQEETDLLSKL